jgi:dTDP-4-amino-4,6-dideoxygalactose transaminase
LNFVIGILVCFLNSYGKVILMKKLYTLIYPAFDSPKGKTRELVNALLGTLKKGEGGGAEEFIALADVILKEEGLPNVNYIPALGGAVNALCVDFLKYLTSFKQISHPLFAEYGKRRNVKEVPLFICCAASATSGLAASLIANGVTSGEVITTSLNFLGVPNAIVLAGAAPKFVDINPGDWCMDAKSLENAISKKTKAIILVHFNQFVDFEPIDKLLRKKGLDVPLIQDASLAMGSTCKGLPAGIINVGAGGTTVYSFATSKILSGLGGAVVIGNDMSVIKKIQSIAYQGLNLENMEEMENFGANFKMNDMNAAIVMEQLKKREAIFKKRRQLKKLYDEKLKGLVDGGKISVQRISSESIVTHYGILVPDRRELVPKMSAFGIPIGMWHCAHMHEIYQKRFKTKPGTLPVTESIANRIAFLPFHTKLEEADVDYICDSLAKVI